MLMQEKNLLSSSVRNSLDVFLPSPTLVEALTATSYKLYFSKKNSEILFMIKYA